MTSRQTYGSTASAARLPDPDPNQGEQEVAEPARVQLKRRSLTARLLEVLRYFGPFGFLAFGGTAANILQLKQIFVDKQQWVDETTFVDLFALGNALPGPALSQLAFSVALLRGGMIPALLSFFLLSGPGAGAMLGIGFAIRSLPSDLPPIVYASFSGLNSAAVGLIAHSAYTLSHKVVTDPITRLIVLLSGSIGSCYDSQWLYPALMVAGGSSTWAWDVSAGFRSRISRKWQVLVRRKAAESDRLTTGEATGATSSRAGPALPTDVDLATQQVSIKDQADVSPINATEALRSTPPFTTTGERDQLSVSRRSGPTPAPPASSLDDDEENLVPSLYFKLSVRGGLVLCAAFITFFLGIVIARSVVKAPTQALDFFTNILLAGTLIFGGGPVVIPLLRGYTVDPGWVLPRDFLIGLAIQQALPGPVVNFAIYLGVLAFPAQPLVGALLASVGIYGPGIILKVGALPFYLRWRTSKTTRSILRGLNAAAIGLIYAAVYHLFRIGVIAPSADADPNVPAVYLSLDTDGFWVSIVGATFVCVDCFGVPAPGAILGGVLGGLAWYGVTSA